mmetsp:Transcript_5245/g.12472  ORF Transcript_5245/g.12472 Transcript_5245/m.12472 type:complete len:399 (-) Transcript_5245:46-1242(-)
MTSSCFRMLTLLQTLVGARTIQEGHNDLMYDFVHASSNIITSIDRFLHGGRSRLRRDRAQTTGQYNFTATEAGIAHGKLVTQDEVPSWMGGLYIAPDTGDECGALCGGALISPGVFVVAAHCVFGEIDEDGQLSTLEHKLDVLRVALQQAYVPTPEECESGQSRPIPSEHVYKVTAAHRHCDWSPEPDAERDTFLYKDIAVLYLDRCADVETARFAGRGFHVAAGTSADVYGWGEDEHREESSYLKKASMTIASVGTTDQDCHHSGPTHPGVMCSDLENGKAPGARSGDSGGPVMVGGTHVGIVSGGGERNAQLVRTAYYQKFLEVVVRHDPCYRAGDAKGVFDKPCEDCGPVALASYYPPLRAIDKDIAICGLPRAECSAPALAFLSLLVFLRIGGL